MSKLRKLRFKKLSEIVQEAETLLQKEYEQGGEWTLGQISQHLAVSIRQLQKSMDLPFPGVMKWGAFMFATAMARTSQANDIQLPTMAPPSDDVSDEEGVQQLRKAIKRYKRSAKRNRRGVFNKYTMGKSAVKQSRKYHLKHCSHHFSFLKPKGE